MAQLFIEGPTGHETPPPNAPGLAAAAAGTSAVGTIIPVNAGLGVGSSITLLTGVTPTDRRGSFNAVAAGTPAAGVIATVFFAKPYAQIPAAVVVSAVDTTDTTATVTVAAGSITTTGFNIVSTIPTAAKTYIVSYVVVA